MDLRSPGKFVNYRSQSDEFYIPSDEVNSITTDVTGNMWIGSIGGGAWMINTSKPLFTKQTVNLLDNDIPTTAARSLLNDNDNNLWIGIGTYGLALLDAKTKKLTLQTDLPEFEGRTMPSIYAMLQRRTNNEIWFGTYNGGIFIYKKGEKVKILNQSNAPFIPSSVGSETHSSPTQPFTQIIINKEQKTVHSMRHELDVINIPLVTHFLRTLTSPLGVHIPQFGNHCSRRDDK